MGKRSFRFAPLDVLIIVFVFLFIFVVSQKLLLNQGLYMPEQKISLTIVLENQRDFMGNAISVGDSVYQKGASQPFGIIKNIEIKPAETVVVDSNGNTFLREVPEHLDTFIMIESLGFISKAGSPIIDNSFFHLNQYLPVHTNKVKFATRVVEIR